jgi:hypothetical protein
VDFSPAKTSIQWIFLAAAVGLGNRGVDDLDHDRRDIDADAVALDEGNDRIVRDRLPRNDFLTALRNLDVRCHIHSLSCYLDDLP